MKSLKPMDHSRGHIYAPKDLGDKAADRITTFVGSWTFVGIHAIWFGLWILLRVEPFPYGLLTLLVSLEAIFLSTFVMMSQNRSADRDRLRDDHEAEEVDMLYQINQTQLEILNLLRASAPTDGIVRTAQAQPHSSGAEAQQPLHQKQGASAVANRRAPSQRRKR